MSGHLHLHVGPPKTATTALQYGLQDISAPGFVYLGAFQPRERHTNPATRALHAYCQGELECDDSALTDLVDRITRLVADDTQVFVSEEMLLVWERKQSFWAKLERLETLFASIPHTYLVTLRNPAEALPSYYQEIHRQLTLIQKLRPASFFNHERCDCYDYDKLLTWFESRQLTARAVDISALSQSVDLSAICHGDAGHDATITFPVANVGRKSASDQSRELPSLGMADLLPRSSLRPLVQFCMQKCPRSTESLKRILGRLVLRRSGARPLTVPGERAMALDASYQAALARTETLRNGQVQRA